MNNLIRILLLCLSLFYWHIAYAQNINTNLAQFSKGNICDIKVGDVIGDLLNDGEKVEVVKESGEGRSYFIFNVKVLSCGFVKTYVDDHWTKIFRLESDFKKYTTSRGARVGMTLKEIKALYPDGQLSARFFTDATSLYSFYLPEDQGQFDFDGTGIQEKCGKPFAECGRFLDELKSVRFVTY
ncbi:MAG: hypothetical protein H6912_05070 [Kordiimonadaceae bacterium]|nr:hypothetical protein [Kordiimonadaceae bacterium]